MSFFELKVTLNIPDLFLSLGQLYQSKMPIRNAIFTTTYPLMIMKDCWTDHHEDILRLTRYSPWLTRWTYKGNAKDRSATVVGTKEKSMVNGNGKYFDLSYNLSNIECFTSFCEWYLFSLGAADAETENNTNSPPDLVAYPPVPPRKHRRRHTPPRPPSNGLPPTPKVHMGACFSKVRKV